MVVVVVVRRRIREEEVVDDDGEDPFPNAFVAFSLLPPFALPFRPEDRVLFKEKNLGEEEAESAAFIVIVEKFTESFARCCCSSAREFSDEERKELLLLEGTFASKASQEQTRLALFCGRRSCTHTRTNARGLSLWFPF